MHKAGSDIRAWRIDRDMTATDLADLLAKHGILVSPQTVYSWERGKVARPNAARVLADMDICTADDWLRKPEPDAKDKAA